MTAPAQPSFDELLRTLASLSSKLSGREGTAIREHLQELANVLASQSPGGSDTELRARAATALEQLIEAVAQLGVLGPGAQALRGLNLGSLVDGLRTFVGFLRAPTGENQAQVEQLIADLQGSPVLKPVPLDELQIDGTVEALAIESARRHGLEGAELQRAVGRMKREMSTLVRQLELRARAEAQRTQTASELERLLDALIGNGSALGKAVALERAALVHAFRTVDLAHMAAGLRVFGRWLSTASSDPAAHVADLKARFAEALGPPTAGDPARSEAERRADFERDIQVAVDEIFRATRPAPS
jgi:hypothetical protein